MPLEAPPKAPELPDLPLLETLRLPTRSPPPPLLRLVVLACCWRALDCRADMESPRAVPPNLSAVALSP